MPTVVLLDVSLSMAKPLSCSQTGNSGESHTCISLAVRGLKLLFEHISTHLKLEFSMLVQFSSLWEVLVPFTRDYCKLKSALDNIECFDKTYLESVLSGVTPLIMDEWGTNQPMNIIVITDSVGGIAPLFQSMHSKKLSDDFPLPFPFPAYLNFVLIADPKDAVTQKSVVLYEKVLDQMHVSGDVVLLDGEPSVHSIEKCFSKLADANYTPCNSLLCCGNLTSRVVVFPSPKVFTMVSETKAASNNSIISVCGFLDLADVASPPIISRHLVLPRIPPTKTKDGKMKDFETCGTEDEDEVDSDANSKSPSFCVLLHGSLKVESMVAICVLSDNWYGMLYSWADSKKKSNLMLSVFEQGEEAVPWLGRLGKLFPLSDFCSDGNQPPFPVKPSERHSYSQNCVVWIRQTGLQTDIQKILRHGRKLPEKQQQFYKELNRLRKAALAFGFHELLDGLASILERECSMLPAGVHPDAALQLTHAAATLRSSTQENYHNTITPLRTNFSSNDD